MEDEPNEPREDESPFEIRPVFSEMEAEKEKEAETEEEVELPKTPQEEQLGYNSMVWAEALFKRFIDAISGRGGVEAITGYADQIDFIELLTPLRQRMKNNDMFFQTALSKCNKDLLKRPLLIREDESYDILGFTCDHCSKQLLNRKSYCGCGGKSRPLAVKVFRKLRTEGLRKITPETVLMDVAYDKLADAYCCHPETVVFTNDSLKPICEVEKGDSVLDHRGYFSGVLDVLKRPYKGNLVQIRTYHSNLPIKLTPNHPVLAVPAKRKGRCFGRSRCYKAIPRFLWKGRHAYWVPAGDLRVGDLVLFPRLARTRPNPVICLGSRQGASLLGKDWKCDGEKIWTQGSHSLVDAKLPLSEDLMRLFGYYLAEGCTGANTKQISFCFNITEIEYAEDVKNLVRETLKIEATEFKRGNWMYVFVNSSAYAKLFRRLFGTNARTKKIPRLLLESSASLQEELIKGYWRGDGCLTPYGFDFSTSSAVLASQIKLILTRLGFKAAYRQFSRKNGIGKNPNKCQLKYTVRVQCDADSVGRLSVMLGVPHSRLAFTYGVRPKQRFFLHKRFALVPIRSIESVFYEGDVWNLKVNDSHSYTLSNFVVHNCDAFNAFRLVTTKTAELFGWEDRFRIENPELLNYMDHYFLGRLPGESKIPREEKEVLQFLVRGNIVLIPLPTAFDLIRQGISVVKYGYMFEVLGCTGADLRYRELAATFGDAYDAVNKTIRKELYADREERKRTKTSVNKVVDGIYAPCMLMPRHFWENGTIANQVILEPVFKLPVHPKADDGSLQMLYAPIGKGKTFLLSSIVTYGVDIKHELVFNVLGDKSNSFMLSCLPLFGYNARTNALVKRLDEELGVQPHGIPTLNLTFLRKDEKVPNEKTTNPPTKYDRIIRIDDPHDFEVPFDLIMAEFKKIVKDFDYTKAVGIINVRNLDRVVRLGTKESENIDVQVAINILTKFDAWRKGDLTQSMRLLIDEMSYVAPSQVMLYAGDASRSGATISDFLKESRRDNCSIDGATQRPLEIITDIRDSSTNVFFRELPASKAKDKSQIDFILESILLYDPSVRPIVRDISNRGLLSKDHYWFWWNKQTRSINVIRPSPPTFCLQDPKKTSTQIIKMYEKDTGEQILLGSWDEVPTLTHAASDAHKEKVGAIPI